MLLETVRVLEWNSESIATAFCTKLLADLGAHVTKAEDASGDPRRLQGTLLDLPDGRQVGALFAYLNSRKHLVRRDPAASAADALVQLAQGQDIVVVGSRIDDAINDALRDIRRRNPATAVIVITPFGRSEPWSDTGSFGSDMVMQHRSGLAYEQARPVEDPQSQSPIGGADREAPLAAGLAAASACVSALLATQNRDGHAPLIDVSKLDFFAHLCFDAFCAFQRGETDFSRKRKNSEGIEVAGGLVWTIPCSDGWVIISPREQHQWDRWVALIGNPDWTTDPQLCGDAVARKKNASIIQTRISDWSLQRTKDEVFKISQAARVPCFPVSTSADLLKNEQLHAREFFNTIETAQGPVLVPGLPFRLTTSDGRTLPRGRPLDVPA